MKKTSLTMFFMLFVFAWSCKSQKNDLKMENEIKSVIETFAKAGAQNNIALYDTILHPDFRVIANRYPTAEKTSIIPKEVYVGLIESKKIGGTQYKVNFQNISIQDHSATVMVNFIGDKSKQSLTFLLVLDSSNQWKIISDMAVQN